MKIPEKLLTKWKALKSPGDAEKMSNLLPGSAAETFNRAFRQGKCRDDVFKTITDFFTKKEEELKELIGDKKKSAVFNIILFITCILLLASCSNHYYYKPAPPVPGAKPGTEKVVVVKVKNGSTYAKLQGHSGWYPVNDSVKINSFIPVVWVNN